MPELRGFEEEEEDLLDDEGPLSVHVATPVALSTPLHTPAAAGSPSTSVPLPVVPGPTSPPPLGAGRRSPLLSSTARPFYPRESSTGRHGDLLGDEDGEAELDLVDCEFSPTPSSPFPRPTSYRDAAVQHPSSPRPASAAPTDDHLPAPKPKPALRSILVQPPRGEGGNRERPRWRGCHPPSPPHRPSFADVVRHPPPLVPSSGVRKVHPSPSSSAPVRLTHHVDRRSRQDKGRRRRPPELVFGLPLRGREDRRRTLPPRSARQCAPGVADGRIPVHQRLGPRVFDVVAHQPRRRRFSPPDADGWSEVLPCRC
jgi:hypothetical protein